MRHLYRRKSDGALFYGEPDPDPSIHEGRGVVLDEGVPTVYAPEDVERVPGGILGMDVGDSA